MEEKVRFAEIRDIVKAHIDELGFTKKKDVKCRRCGEVLDSWWEVYDYAMAKYTFINGSYEEIRKEYGDLIEFQCGNCRETIHIDFTDLEKILKWNKRRQNGRS